MNVVAWDPEKHRATLDRWAKERRLGPDAGPPDLYPTTGAVTDTAICFIYFTDAPGRAYLDDLITDPKAMPEARREGTRTVFRALLREAALRGVRVVLAATRHGMPMFELEQLGFRRTESGLTWLVRAKE